MKSRALLAPVRALLVVDATQGVEAETIANVYIALDNNLEIIPVINKIDLPAADVPKVCSEIEESIGLECSNAISVSAKSGIGIAELLESIVRKVLLQVASQTPLQRLSSMIAGLTTT